MSWKYYRQKMKYKVFKCSIHSPFLFLVVLANVSLTQFCYILVWYTCLTHIYCLLFQTMGMMYAILVFVVVQVFVNRGSSLNDVTSFRARLIQPKENASYSPSTGINNTLTTNFNSTKKALKDFHDKNSVVHCDIVLSRGPLFQKLLPTRSRCFMGRK